MSNVPPASSSGRILGSEDIDGFSYGLGLSVGILLLLITITLTSYFCARIPPRDGPSTIIGLMPVAAQGSPECIEEVGLDETTLSSYPKLLYSQAKMKNKDSIATSCSICLTDYKGNDTLRLLPDCDHLFHLKCVDPWLRKHPTCPLCRTSPLPTPMAMPLAEVVPLANRPVHDTYV